MYLTFIYSRQPLLNQAKKGRSAEEIKEILQKCTANVIRLEKYNEGLHDGMSQAQSNRKDMHNLMADSFQILQRARTLLKEYDGEDSSVYGRKLNNIAERLKDIIEDIKEKENKDLDNIRKSMVRVSMAESSEETDQEKQRLKIQLDENFKVLEEAEYMEEVIDQRK